MPGLLYNLLHRAGIAQLAERKLPKLEVAGSTPVARSILFELDVLSPDFSRFHPTGCHVIMAGKLNPIGGVK